MMRSNLHLVGLLVLALTTTCTQIDILRPTGRTTTVTLQSCQKLVNAAWREAGIWYLTRPFRPGETAESYRFREYSTYGLMNGTVVIVEQCSSTP